MKYLLLISALILVSATITYSQEKITKEAFLELKSELEGTYQIQMIGTRAKPAIDSDHFLKINKLRKEDEDTYYYVSDKVRFLILSDNKISSGSLIDNESRIIYVNQ